MSLFSDLKVEKPMNNRERERAGGTIIEKELEVYDILKKEISQVLRSQYQKVPGNVSGVR